MVRSSHCLTRCVKQWHTGGWLRGARLALLDAQRQACATFLNAAAGEYAGTEWIYHGRIQAVRSRGQACLAIRTA